MKNIKKSKKGNYGLAIIIAVTIIFFVIAATIVYDNFKEENKISEADEILFQEIENTNTKENQTEEKTFFNSVLDWFSSEDEQQEGQSYEDKTYAELNEKERGFSEYIEILKNSPKLIFAVLGLKPIQALISFLIVLVTLWITYLSWQQLKSIFGRS